MNDISNQKLFGMISADVIISATVMLCVGAMAWQALADDVSESKKDVAEIRGQQKEIIDNQHRIDKHVESISAHQADNTENIKRIERNVEYIRQVLDKAYTK